MPKLCNPRICFRRMLWLVATMGLLPALAGCSEYKPAGPAESNSPGTEETGEKAG